MIRTTGVQRTTMLINGRQRAAGAAAAAAAAALQVDLIMTSQKYRLAFQPPTNQTTPKNKKDPTTKSVTKQVGSSGIHVDLR